MKIFIRYITFLLTLTVLLSCETKHENGRSIFDQAMIEWENQNLPVAYRQFHRAAAAFKEEGDNVGVFEANSHLGIICGIIGQKREGYKLLKSTKYYHVKKKGNYSSQYYWRMMAYYAFTLDNDYKTALTCMKNLLELDKKDFPGKKTWLYMDMANMAEMFYVTGQTAKAWETIKRLESNPLKDDRYLSQTYYVHSMLLEKEGQTDSSRIYAKMSMEYSSRYGEMENEANALKIIMRSDSINGNLTEYIRNRDKYDSLAGVIKNGETAQRIAVIKEQYKYNRIIREAEKTHIIRILLFSGLALTAIAACIIILLLYRQNKMRLKTEEEEHKRLETEVEYKKLENELISLKMNQTISELEKTKNKNAETVAQIVGEATARQTAMTRLDMLEATINTDFVEYIKKTYPQLTHNDILILGFMRMKIPVKETATALGISTESLQKARYRLRKKMNIESVEELFNLVNEWKPQV